MRIVEVYEENGKTLTLREREGHLDLVMGNVPLLTSRALSRNPEKQRQRPRHG